jgi:hypothetical protein
MGDEEEDEIGECLFDEYDCDGVMNKNEEEELYTVWHFTI